MLIEVRSTGFSETCSDFWAATLAERADIASMQASHFIVFPRLQERDQLSRVPKMKTKPATECDSPQLRVHTDFHPGAKVKELPFYFQFGERLKRTNHVSPARSGPDRSSPVSKLPKTRTILGSLAPNAHFPQCLREGCSSAFAPGMKNHAAGRNFAERSAERWLTLCVNIYMRLRNSDSGGPQVSIAMGWE